jgi:hypothetical protein
VATALVSFGHYSYVERDEVGRKRRIIIKFRKLYTEEFRIQNGPKQGDALSPLLFNFALEYAIREVQ